MERNTAGKQVLIKRVNRVFDGYLKIDEATFDLERSDGTILKNVMRLSMERGDSAGALLVDSKPSIREGKPSSARIWLIEQFRYSSFAKGPGWIQELPTGVVEDGEDPADTARREVWEETGLQVQDLEPISTFYVSPGGTSERIFLYFGRVDGQNPVQRKGLGSKKEGEDINLVPVCAKAFCSDAAVGRIDDAKTLIAGLWLAANMNRIWV